MFVSSVNSLSCASGKSKIIRKSDHEDDEPIFFMAKLSDDKFEKADAEETEESY